MKKLLLFLTNPHLLLCFAIAWLLTNGWSYILLWLGVHFDIRWMAAVAGTYLAFLWLPLSPEKLVTLAVALALLRLLFPHDQKTLAVLRELRDKAKRALRQRRQDREAPPQ